MNDFTPANRCPLCGENVPVLDRKPTGPEEAVPVRCAVCIREGIQGYPGPPRREPR